MKPVHVNGTVKSGWAIYDPCTEAVIGPMMEAPEVVEDFLKWMPKDRARDLTARELEMLYGQYKRGRLYPLQVPVYAGVDGGVSAHGSKECA